ncbi:MAG: hypothetical protein V4539_10095 [Bacteroidota bacterium]
MSFDHMPGTIVIILDTNLKPAGEVEVQMYLDKEKAYKVWWTYPQTGESELIRVPAWRLIKKPRTPAVYEGELTRLS